MAQLETPRLVLRDWRASDHAPFRQLNADPEVMRYFTETLSATESDALAARIEAALREHGWGLWAVEVAGGSSFIGFVGLGRVPFHARFTPAIEVGWRLDRRDWGRGYATEAAGAALDFGFGRLGSEQIVSFTAAENERSRRLMERLGMTRDAADDFDHPEMADGPLRRHVLYRMSRARWIAAAGTT